MISKEEKEQKKSKLTELDEGRTIERSGDGLTTTQTLKDWIALSVKAIWLSALMVKNHVPVVSSVAAYVVRG